MNPFSKEKLRVETIKSLVDATNAGKLQSPGTCAYVSNPGEVDCRPCAVGFLMTPEERDEVLERKCNSAAVFALQERMPATVGAISRRTGLNFDELIEIQRKFDGRKCDGEFIHYLTREL